VALFAGRYELGPLIGRGGMAQVFAATDTRLDRPVAVKLMRSEVAHQTVVRERFETEARLAARLSHPNVVAVYDSGEEGGIPFIVMERLPGETLADLLAAGPMRVEDARAMLLDVLAALDVAHAAGVLHRDIKPANILEGGGRWKVADFGIAKAREVTQGDATATGLVLGTPAYLAPERLFGAPATVASDLYSVGMVAYEALAGRRPFDAGTAEGWAGVAATAPVPPLASQRPGVDPALAAAVERSLAKDPAQRYAGAAEMAAALSGAVPVAATRMMAAVPPGPPTTVIPAGGPPTQYLPPAVALADGRRSRSSLVLVALALLLALAAGIVALAATHRHHARPSTTTIPPAPTSITPSPSSSTSTST
jgi:serine/threonine-protein kinase